MRRKSPKVSAAAWPSGDGEMAKRIRAFDWAATPLGPIEAWPQSLRATVDLMLDSRTIMALPWGPQFILLYNDAYSHLIGPRSAVALGRPVFDTLPELREILMPQLERARTGESVQFSDQLHPFIRTTELEDAWFDISHTPVRGDTGEVLAVLSIIVETTDRVLAERRRKEASQVLRANKEQQTFLLKLSDALRPLSDPAEIEGEACRLLAKYLDVDRAYFVEVDEVAGIARVQKDFVRGSAPSLAGEHRVADFAWSVAILRRGECHVIADTQTSELVPNPDRPACAALQITACMGAPLIKKDRLIGALCITDARRREWRGSDVEILREVGERIWAAVERARAEGALRQSEEKYRNLFDSIDEGFAIIEMIWGEDGKPVDFIHLEANQAHERHTGLRDIVGKRVLEIVPEADVWLEFYGNVARTGEAARIESYVEFLDRWFACHASRVEGDGSSKVAVIFNDITVRKRAEQALRESEERQTFLLELSDALRPLADPEEIRLTAAQVLGRYLGANRVAYAENVEDEFFNVTRNYVDGAADVVGRYRYADYGSDILSGLKAGRTRVQPDIRNDMRLSDAEKQALANASVGASLNVPLVKEGRLVAFLGVNYPAAHDFLPREIELVREVAERTWAAVERARAEAALRDGEARFRLIVEAARDYAIFTINAAGIIDSWPPGAVAVLGWSEEDAVGQHFAMTFLPEDVAKGEPERELMTAHEMGVAPDVRRHRHKNGVSVFIEGSTRALYDGNGAVRGFLKIGQDITERRAAEQALRESEERFRQFGQSSTDALWIRDAATLRMEYVSPAFEAIYGETRDRVIDQDPQSWLELIVPEDRELAMSKLEQVRRGERVTFEFRIERPSDGEVRWLRNIDFPLLDVAGRVQRIGGIGHDITETKRTAERMEIMVAELQHRTRNLLTVVRGLAAQTLKSSGSLPEFKAMFDDRLSALSRVQGMLSRSNHERITIGALIRMELDALGAETARDRVVLAGPDVPLRNTIVQTLSLALHELATNARKHGALAAHDGKLNITWSVSRQEVGQPRHLLLEWIETGADNATLENARIMTRHGYGRELIERALPYSLGANTSLTFGDTGIRCIIDLPLDRPGKREAP